MKRFTWKTILPFLVYVLVFPPWTIELVQAQEIRTRESIIAKFFGQIPREWGEVVKGVKTKLDTEQKVLALTFDACGGPRGSNYDEKLVQYLESEKTPATLFVSGKWIDAHPEIIRRLAGNPLFQIENHGLNHKPCSAIGRSAYGIKGTNSVREIYDEIELNALKILKLTGRKSKYYRPGTVYSDEICVEIANALGYEVVNFSVRGDAGATYSEQQVKDTLLQSTPASIILMHMNRPKSQTAEGVIETLPELRKRGFRFVRVSDFGLK
jgi:peptidoglycan/xylan/chitin deacetylase (PgdA/CDA1 family)